MRESRVDVVYAPESESEDEDAANGRRLFRKVLLVI